MAAANLTSIERWLPVVGFEGIYDVSDHGRVKRVKGGPGAVVGRIIRHCINQYGYPQLVLHEIPRLKTFVVHHLVLEAFVGKCPEGMQCRHLDGTRDNNLLENLQWGTHEENEADKEKHGTILKGEQHGRSKLTERAVREIRAIRKHLGWTHKKIAIAYRCSKPLVGNIVNRDLWRHI